METCNMKSIGERVRMLRVRKNMSQESLSHETPIHLKNTPSKLLCGFCGTVCAMIKSAALLRVVAVSCIIMAKHPESPTNKSQGFRGRFNK